MARRPATSPPTTWCWPFRSPCCATSICPRPGSIRSSSRRSRNRGAATTARSSSSSPIGTGRRPGRGPACPTARATPTPATRPRGRRRRAQPGAKGILVGYSGGSVTDALTSDKPFATASNAAVRADAVSTLAQLETVFPGLRPKWNGRAILSLPNKSPFFRASYSFYRIGQYTTFAGYEAEPPGRRPVLRRAHVDRLPGVHGGRRVGGEARGQGASANYPRRLAWRRVLRGRRDPTTQRYMHLSPAATEDAIGA